MHKKAGMIKKLKFKALKSSGHSCGCAFKSLSAYFRVHLSVSDLFSSWFKVFAFRYYTHFTEWTHKKKQKWKMHYLYFPETSSTEPLLAKLQKERKKRKTFMMIQYIKLFIVLLFPLLLVKLWLLITSDIKITAQNNQFVLWICISVGMRVS